MGDKLQSSEIRSTSACGSRRNTRDIESTRSNIHSRPPSSSALSAAASAALVGGTEADLQRLFSQVGFVHPKYSATKKSMAHMKTLEQSPHLESGRNLRRVISEKSFTR